MQVANDVRMQLVCVLGTDIMHGMSISESTFCSVAFCKYIVA